MEVSPPPTLHLEPLGRLWQQAWLLDVPTGGPLRFAEWLAALPADLDGAPSASWRLDLLVAERVADPGAAPVTVAPEPGGRCLPAEAIALLEAVLAELTTDEVPLEEAVTLLEPAVTELADSEHWPVPSGQRANLTSLAAQLADRLTAAGVQVADVSRLLAVPAESANPETVRGFDLGRAAAACLDVPRAVLESAPRSER